MIIAIVSTSREKNRFYEELLSSHTLIHFTPEEVLTGMPDSCDGFLLDADLWNGDHGKLQDLLGEIRGLNLSVAMAGEDSHPCMVRYNSDTGLQFQCGRVAAASPPGLGIASVRSPARMETVIFQDGDRDHLDESPQRRKSN